MESLLAFWLAFGGAFLSELGDKSQLLTISLASKWKPRPVFAGVLTGIWIITAIGVAIGAVLLLLVPIFWVQIGGGVLFLAFGVWSYVRANATEVESAPPPRNVFLSSLSLSLLAEFGDKTQLYVIFLTASQEAPISVFLGAALAHVCLTLAAVILGRGLQRKLDPRWLRLVSSGLFVIVGIVVLAEALLQL